ncbi:MAG: type II secretion system F family protein [Alsobacter sp.]
MIDPTKLAVGILAALAAGGVAYAVAYPWISGAARAEQRQKAFVITTPAGKAASRARQNEAQQRRDKVASSLKELETKQQEVKKLTLERKLAQAGLDWDKKKFWMVSAFAGVLFGLAVMLATLNPIAAATAAFVGGLGLPTWVLGFLRKRRMKKFIEELPNAMDVIVRGIRSGLPLGDCLRMIASEAAEPVRTEFRTMVEAQALGMPVGEAALKLYERVPVPEANFFGIVISIQQKSGGNLSEVLSNLSKVIRERKKMRGKISAMSMEAKASAAIIGSLPIIVGALVYASSPAYIELLWTTIHGRIWMAIGGFLMLCGTLVMRKMISFDI